MEDKQPTTALEFLRQFQVLYSFSEEERIVAAMEAYANFVAVNAMNTITNY